MYVFPQDACSGRTSLHYAVEAENFILVNFLLENGCNVNSATFSGAQSRRQTKSGYITHMFTVFE